MDPIKHADLRRPKERPAGSMLGRGERACQPRLHPPHSPSFLLLTTEMTEVVSIQFTQEQARTLTGVSPETVRHWRRAIPYLAAKAGKAARYTFPELVGLAATNEVVRTLGVHIAVVSDGVDTLFRLLASSNVTYFQDAVAVITADNAALDRKITAFEQSALIVPLKPLVSRIQQSMLPALSNLRQTALPFPPKIVRSRS